MNEFEPPMPTMQELATRIEFAVRAEREALFALTATDPQITKAETITASGTIHDRMWAEVEQAPNAALRGALHLWLRAKLAVDAHLSDDRVTESFEEFLDEMRWYLPEEAKIQFRPLAQTHPLWESRRIRICRQFSRR